MVRLCFIHPPVRASEPARHVPMGIAQLSAVALDWGAEIGLEDINAKRINIDVMTRDMVDEEKEWGPWDIVAFSGLITTYRWQKEAIKSVKRALPHALVMAGGGCASALHEDMLKWVPELDAIAYGEGENTLLELLAAASVGEHFDVEAMKEIKGLKFRDDISKWRKKAKTKYNKVINNRGKAKILDTGVRPLMTEDELNELPYPLWTLFSLMPSIEQGMRIPGYFANSALALSQQALRATRRLDVICERGCAGRCRFCSHNLMGGDFLREDHCELYGEKAVTDDKGTTRLMPLMRYQSVDYLIELIKHMLIKYKVDFISIMDETFLFNRSRASMFVDALEANDLVGSFMWGCLGRPENPDEALLGRLKQAGCTYISYGFESSNQSMLDYLEKGTTVKGQEETLKATIAAGINPITTYIVGYPDETLQSLYDSCRFWTTHGIYSIQPFYLTPYPYTRIYWENEERILDQYGGDKEAFVMACGDATAFVVNLTNNFSDVELRGLRQTMIDQDLAGIRAFGEQKYLETEDPIWLIDDPDPPKRELRGLEGLL